MENASVWRRGARGGVLSRERESRIRAWVGGPQDRERGTKAMTLSADVPWKGGGSTTVKFHIPASEFEQLCEVMLKAEPHSALKAFAAAIETHTENSKNDN